MTAFSYQIINKRTALLALAIRLLLTAHLSLGFVGDNNFKRSTCRRLSISKKTFYIGKIEQRFHSSSKLAPIWLFASKEDTNNSGWAQQLQLAEEMSTAIDKSLSEEQRDKFAARRLALVGDTAFIGYFIACVLWTVFDNPFITLSYTVGALAGTAYAYGLGVYVENLGQTTDDENSAQRSGFNVGDARFAFLIFLFIIVNRFRSSGILVLPTILGFFTYQIASLSQGLRKLDD